MLDSFFALIQNLAGESPPAFEEGDYRLAAAALLIHVMTVDGKVTPAEETKLETILSAGFAMTPPDTRRLIEAATGLEQETVDMVRFTGVLRRALDEPARQRIVAMLWDLVLADGQAVESEDATVARAAELLGVSARP
ncbi:tellurite resistance TerB family protein [Phreatobacter aquaticus]|nr:TerB family tellurite resistance protein [Phreatobacter aquaticus]